MYVEYMGLKWTRIEDVIVKYKKKMIIYDLIYFIEVIGFWCISKISDVCRGQCIKEIALLLLETARKGMVSAFNYYFDSKRGKASFCGERLYDDDHTIEIAWYINSIITRP